MIKKIKVAVLISGRGSNMENLIKASQNPDFPAQIALVISNKEDAKGLEIAKNHGVKTAFINHKKFSSRQDFDGEMHKLITANDCQIICLAGFMRLLSPQFVQKWQGKMINIHPSLLPAFKGANAVEDALNYGVKYSGCTVHFVSEEMDCGKIIKQAVVEVLENDTKESLAARILKEEHVIYVSALEELCKKNIK